MRDFEPFEGRWQGGGTDHDGQPFRARAHLRPILGGRGVQISFEATGEDGTLFHGEETIVALDPTSLLATAWSFNTNSGLTVLTRCRPEGPHAAPGTLQFSTGDLDDAAVFRERISLVPGGDGSWTYAYEWGLPGGEFGPASAARLEADPDERGEP